MSASLLEGLNSAQREAVTSTASVILALAGAGSGKTTVLTRRVAYLHQEHRIGTANMLCLTFTRLAGKEMKERVMRLVGDAEGKKLFCNTFHAFAVSVLRDFGEKVGIEPNFSIYDDADQESIVKSIIEEQRRSCKLEEVRHDLAQLTTGSESQFLSEESEQVAREYLYRLRQSNAVQLDHLILLVNRLWEDHPEVLERYQGTYSHVFVDEFQDADDTQAHMLQLLNPVNLFVVGDDYQAIYGWRGAQVDYIITFPEVFPGSQVVKLEDNYRSTHPIVAAANNLIAYNKHQTEKQLVAHKEGLDVKFSSFDDEYDEARRIIHKIKALTEPAGTTNSDIAVLARTNYQVDRIYRLMEEMHVPAQRISGTDDPFRRPDVKKMIAWLDLYINRQDDNALKQALSFPREFVSPLEVKRLELIALESDCPLIDVIADSDKAPEFMESLEHVARAIDEEFFWPSDSLRVLVETLRLGEFYAQKGLRNRRLDAERAYQYMKVWEQSKAELGEGNTLSYFLKWLRHRDVQEKLIQDEDAVKLMTVHAAKGLEFNTVFVVGLAQGVFPSKRSENLEEERRLFYVACTRAKERLYISSPNNIESWNGEKMQVQPSQFIAELQEVVA